MYLLRVFLLLVLSLCCLSTRQNERRKKTETVYFSAEDFDRKDWKYRNVFDSGPIETNRWKPFLLRDYDNPKATSKSKTTKKHQCKAHKLPKKCRLLRNCHEVDCELNVLGNDGSMKITIPPISTSLTATVQITVKKRKIHSTYHLKAGKSSPGVVIKEFGYKIGDMQTQVEFSFSLKTLSGGKLSVKIFATTRGQVSGFTKYQFKTKFLAITTTSKLSKKMMGNKEKQVTHSKSGYSSGPCANIPLPSVCSITSDCLKFSCALKFIGQQISLSFGINKCDNPLTLSVSVNIPALKIKWSYKMKSGRLIPIPGYGVSVGAIEGGVLIEVLLKPVRSRLALQVKLIVGARVGFIRVFPINFRLLRLRLPIKIKGCGKSKSDYTNTTLPTKNPSNISPLSTPTVYPTNPEDLTTEYPTTSYPTNGRDEYESPTNEDENSSTYNTEEENEYDAARDQTEDNENNGINDEKKGPEQDDMGIVPPMSAYEQLQPLEGDT